MLRCIQGYRKHMARPLSIETASYPPEARIISLYQFSIYNLCFKGDTPKARVFKAIRLLGCAVPHLGCNRIACLDYGCPAQAFLLLSFAVSQGSLHQGDKI